MGPEVLYGGGPHAPGLRWIGALLKCAIGWDGQIWTKIDQSFNTVTNTNTPLKWSKGRKVLEIYSKMCSKFCFLISSNPDELSRVGHIDS